MRPLLVLTKEEILNGWTTETLADYRARREKAANKVPGNLVTEFQRSKDPIRVETVKTYNPHTKWKRP